LYAPNLAFTREHAGHAGSDSTDAATGTPHSIAAANLIHFHLAKIAHCVSSVPSLAASSSETNQTSSKLALRHRHSSIPNKLYWIE